MNYTWAEISIGICSFVIDMQEVPITLCDIKLLNKKYLERFNIENYWLRTLEIMDYSHWLSQSITKQCRPVSLKFNAQLSNLWLSKWMVGSIPQLLSARWVIKEEKILSNFMSLSLTLPDSAFAWMAGEERIGDDCSAPCVEYICVIHCQCSHMNGLLASY